MARYAFFNHTVPDPKPVCGWYNVQDFKYAILPDQDDLLLLTEDQWAARLKDVNGWAVSGGKLVPKTTV